jgi:hypothetical protein
MTLPYMRNFVQCFSQMFSLIPRHYKDPHGGRYTSDISVFLILFLDRLNDLRMDAMHSTVTFGCIFVLHHSTFPMRPYNKE